MGLSPSELGRALVDMASGNDNSPHQAEVQHRRRHLLALKGFGRRPERRREGSACSGTVRPRKQVNDLLITRNGDASTPVDARWSNRLRHSLLPVLSVGYQRRSAR
jgi:hypothetical protein